MRRASFLLLSLLAATQVWAQLTPIPQDEGSVGLGLALRRLPVAGTVLYVTAHPDDEDNGVLVALTRGRGLRTVLLTLTRGEGGQNEIGPELFDALGVVRTEELLAAHRYDGAEQLFGLAFEFGYSFSVEETFAKWGKEATLADVVRAIRAVRPDVILTLPREAQGGGQHHQAAARLAVQAFRDAADPDRFPEQLDAGLQPWQARKVYEGGVGRADRGEGATTLAVSQYDPLLGRTWDELGLAGRAMHRSQGMGFLRPPADRRAGYRLVDAEPSAAGPESDLFDGIDTSLARLAVLGGAQAESLGAELDAVAADIEDARSAYRPNVPHETLRPLRAGLLKLRELRGRLAQAELEDAAWDELESRLQAKEEDFMGAILLAHGISVEAAVDDGDVVPGQAVALKVRIANRGAEPVELSDVSVEAHPGWTSERIAGGPASLGSAQSAETTFAVRVSAHARPSRPYWRRVAGSDRLRGGKPEEEGLPWSPPALQVRISYTSAGVPLTHVRPALWRYAGPRGEKQKVANVVPRLSVRLSPGVAVLPVPVIRPREMRVTVTNHEKTPVAATCRLTVPPGWRVRPASVALDFQREDETRTARFFVTPPVAAKAGVTGVVSAVVFGRDEEEFSEGHLTLAYDHIQDRRLYVPAASRLRTLDARVPAGLVVGYVMGTGDDVPDAIQQLGARVVLLTPEDLAFRDLSRYPTIVLGIRAYQSRPDLVAHHERLMRYVRAGGHLVVQYNRLDFNRGGPGGPAAGDAVSPYTPYPGAVTANRVTVEEAPVRRLLPLHRLLRRPNRITDADFEGWVQERGLHFFGARDARYQELLASEDPWPENAGEKKGLLVDAAVGKGTWTYVGIGLWRQLPAGVPGAYRLLANLISRPRGL